MLSRTVKTAKTVMRALFCHPESRTALAPSKTKYCEIEALFCELFRGFQLGVLVRGVDLNNWVVRALVARINFASIPFKISEFI